MKIGIMQQKTITSQELEAASKNVDYIKIAKSIFRKYPKLKLTADNKKEIFLDALWYSMVNWKPEKSIFTTYFYQNVWYKLLVFAKKNHPKAFTNQNFNRISYQDKDLGDELDNITACLHDRFRTPILQKYVYGMTMAEIGEANGYNKDYANKMIKKGLAILKKSV